MVQNDIKKTYHVCLYMRVCLLRTPDFRMMVKTELEKANTTINLVQQDLLLK